LDLTQDFGVTAGSIANYRAIEEKRLNQVASK